MSDNRAKYAKTGKRLATAPRTPIFERSSAFGTAVNWGISQSRGALQPAVEDVPRKANASSSARSGARA